MTNRDKSLAAWEKEYCAKGIPTSQRASPSRAMVDLIEFLKINQSTPDIALELGCGSGRNAIALAKIGFHAYGADFVNSTETDFLELAASNNVSDRVEFLNHDMREPIPFSDQKFDLIYAMTSLENLIEDVDLLKLRDEIHRSLKVGGYFAVYFLTDQDGFYGPRIEQPSRPRLLVWAEDAEILQRVFTRSEILDLFVPKFSCVSEFSYDFDDVRYGKTYRRDLQMLVFEKQQKHRQGKL